MRRRKLLDMLVGALLLAVVGGVILAATVWRTAVDDTLNDTRTRGFAGCEYVMPERLVRAVDGDAGTVAAGELDVRCAERPERFRLRLALQVRTPAGHWRPAPDGAAERTDDLAEQSFDEEGAHAPGPEGQHYMTVTDCDPAYTVRVTYALRVTRGGHTRSTGTVSTAPVSLRQRC
ncbi:hypothetical protein [Streptomyces huasconensis]|uniref:hypothetical protein n=1 Tax=Streptomyces huasconensis TaxID=1854574 RepID=UPI0033EE9A8C